MRTTITQQAILKLGSARQVIMRFAHDDAGATSIEYGLIIGLMALVCITSFKFLGGSSSGKWGTMAATATAAMTAK